MSTDGNTGHTVGSAGWLANQVDPSQYAVDVFTEGSNSLVMMESQVANVEQGWASGASAQTNVLDAQLTTLVSQMASATGTDLQKQQANFQVQQTFVSNTEQNYGNVVQGATPILNGVQTAQTQLNQLSNTPIQQKGFVNNLITSWS